MELKRTIEQDYINALKARDKFKMSVLSFLKSLIKNKEIDKKDNLTDQEIISLLKTEKKKRLEVMEIYAQQAKQEMLEKEKQEIEIIDKYLPVQASEETIKDVILKVRQSLGEDKNNFGIVMKEVLKELKGGAEGQLVSKLVKEELEK